MKNLFQTILFAGVSMMLLACSNPDRSQDMNRDDDTLMTPPPPPPVRPDSIDTLNDTTGMMMDTASYPENIRRPVD